MQKIQIPKLFLKLVLTRTIHTLEHLSNQETDEFSPRSLDSLTNGPAGQWAPYQTRQLIGGLH
jgi:hypothetical protein